jgi:NADPH:quinone reductase-like Zn-dependent oxidoreductase
LAVIAARLVAHGEPPAFAAEERPEPAPGAGEVVVELKAASLNRRDWWLWRDPDACDVPVTLGSDGAGVVLSTGPGVHGVTAGDEAVIDATLAGPNARTSPERDSAFWAPPG